MSGTDKTDEFDDDFLDIEDEDLSLDDDLDIDEEALLDDDLDEDWDEFDDAPKDNTVIADNAVAANKPKGFISRNFNFIVIFLILILGGGFMYTKFLAPTSQPKPVNQAAIVANNAVDQNNTNDNDSTKIDLNNLRLNEEKTKASLPYEEEIAALDSETEELTNQNLNIDDYAAQELAPEDDLFAEEFDENRIKGNTDSVSDQPPTRVKPRNRLTPMPDFGSKVLSSQKPADRADIDAVIIADDKATEPVTIIESDTPIKAIEPITIPASEIAISNETSDIKNSANETSQNTPDKAITEANDKIEDLANENIELQQTLSTALNETTELEKTIEALENKIAKLQEKPAEIEKKPVVPKPVETQKSAPPAPKKVIKAEPKQQKVAPKIISKTTQPRWVLRSAQPGSAVLKDQNTGNTLNVKVGQAVDSIGSIEFIGLKDGRWSVVGSKSTIRR